MELVDKFIYLGSCISPGGLIKDEVTLRIGKARAAFSSLQLLWRRRDIRLSIKGRYYKAALRSVLLYGSETWALQKEDLRKPTVFDHRCLRSIARIWWGHRISNAEVRRRVLGRHARTLGELTSLHRLRCLGHVLRMPLERLPKRALFTQPCIGWKRSIGGQPMT